VHRFWKVALLALAAALALPTAALADPGKGQGRGPGPDAGWKLTTYDEEGRALEVRSGNGPAPARGEISAMSLSGCNSVDAWRNGYSALGTLVWRFHQVKHWCWSYTRITSVSVGHYVSHLAFTHHFAGIVGQHDFFYSVFPNDGGRGGHDSMRQGRIDNCPLKFGCIGSEYPLVRIWVNGDGWWWYYTTA